MASLVFQMTVGVLTLLVETRNREARNRAFVLDEMLLSDFLLKRRKKMTTSSKICCKQQINKL